MTAPQAVWVKEVATLNIARHYATHGGNNGICELDSCRSLSLLHTVKHYGHASGVGCSTSWMGHLEKKIMVAVHSAHPTLVIAESCCSVMTPWPTRCSLVLWIQPFRFRGDDEETTTRYLVYSSIVRFIVIVIIGSSRVVVALDCN